MEKINEIISKNLVLLRKKNNLKQSDVAEKLKYSYKTISKWETGEIVPSVENLISICSLYQITLNEITTPLDEESLKPIVQKKDYSKQNKIIISLLSVSAVWIIATIYFVYAKVIFNYNAWRIFIWGVPISSIVGIIFSSLWGTKKLIYIMISILIWSLIASFYLQFLKYNLIPIFFIGIPMQIAVLLWSGLKRK